MFVSLLGDGAFLVAMAWQVYTLSGTPTALAFVGIAMSVPTILLLLVGGVVERPLRPSARHAAADLARGCVVAVLAVLSLTGSLELWHMACSWPSTARPGLLRPSLRRDRPRRAASRRAGQANALDQIVRPLAFRLAGPALGGVLIDLVGTGGVFALDALSPSRSPPRRCWRCASPRRQHAGGCVGAELQAICARASPTCAITLALGHLRRAQRSRTCCSWGRPRYCSRCSSRRSWAAAEPSSVWSSAPAASARSAVRSRWASVGCRGATSRSCTCLDGLRRVAVAGYGVATAIWQLMVASLALQRARDGRHDHLGYDEATPRPRGAARPRLEP